MKSILKSLSVLALLLGVVSCQVSNIDGLLNGGKLTVTAVIEGTDASRVSYAVDNETSYTITPTWTVGDKIIGFDDKGVKFTFTVENQDGGEAGLDVGTYVPGSATKLYAVYAPGMTEDQIVDNELPVDISAQDGALHDATKVLMNATAAIEGGTVRFHFEKATAIVGLRKFKLPVTFSTAVTKMKLYGVTTTGTFRVVDGALTLVPGTGTGTVTASRTWTTDASGVCSTPVYFSVIPTKDAEMMLDADTPTKSYALVEGIDKMDIEAGYYYHMTKVFYSPEASVNGEPYGTVVEAFDAANEIDGPVVIKLLSNCQATEPIVLCNVNSEGYTLDLNGKTLTTTDANTITVSLCDLTVTDNSTDVPASYGNITSTSSTKYNMYVQDEGRLLMAKGRLTSPSYRCVRFSEGGSGVLSGNAVISAPNGYALYLTETGGTLDIKDDVQISGKGNVVFYGAGSSEISGGIISNTASGAIVYVSNSAELFVRGNCRVRSSYASNRNPFFANGASAKVHVMGGYYGMPVYNVVTQDENGNEYVNALNDDPATSASYPYTVVPAPDNTVALSTVSSTYEWSFGTMDCASYHANHRSSNFEETSLVLHKDQELSETVAFPSAHNYGLTLDLNGFKIISSASPAVSTGGKMAVEDAVGTGEIVTSGATAFSATAGAISFIGAALTGATTALAVSGSVTATINSGWFAGGTEDITKAGSSKVEIYGGKFKNSPAAAMLGEGCEVNEISETRGNITYSYQVKGGAAAATVNGVDCPSFANALSTALAYKGADDTVTLRLMKDVTGYDKQLDLTNKSGKPFVLDLNGYTLGVVIDSCMTTTGSLSIIDGSGTGKGKYTSSKRKMLYVGPKGKVLVKDITVECTRGGYRSTGPTYAMITVAGGASSTKNTEGITIVNCKVYSNSYLKPLHASYGSLTIEDSEVTCSTKSNGYYVVDVGSGGNVIIRNSSLLGFDRDNNGEITKYGCVHTRTGNTSVGSNIEIYDSWLYSGKGLSTADGYPEYSKVITVTNSYCNVDFTEFAPQVKFAAGTSLQTIDPPAKHTHNGVEYEYGYQVK